MAILTTGAFLVGNAECLIPKHWKNEHATVSGTLLERKINDNIRILYIFHNRND